MGPKASANHGLPQRVTTVVDRPSSSPTTAPDPSTTRRWLRAPATPVPISGGCVRATAKANTAFRKKAAVVIAAIASTIGTRTGPRSTWKDLPWSACSLRSSIASQIHVAGRICTRVRRQWENTSLSPWNSMLKAPAASASGASHRRERLRR